MLRGHLTRRLVAALAVSLLAGCSAAASGPTDAPTPAHVVLTPTTEPARSVTLTWRSSAPAAEQRVVVRDAAGRETTVRASGKGTAHRRYAGTDVPAWTATVKGLRPDTRYTYRLGPRGETVAGELRTARTGLDRPWTFLELGDTQVDNQGVPARIVRQAMSAEPQARLLLHAGDVVDDPNQAKQWDELFGALEPARALPLLASIGNHEQCKLMTCRSGGAEAFTDTFTFPDNGAAQQRPTWFRTDYQGVRFIVLDTFGGDLDAQARFLEDSLRGERPRWTVVLMHQGPFASREDRSSTDVFYDLWPTMLSHDVDLVLTGHDHSYDRGHQGDPDGPVVLTSNSGPKEYPPSDVDWKRRGATRVVWAKHVSTYQVVDVSRDRLRVRAVVGHVGERAVPSSVRVGDVLDSLTITRSGDDKTVSQRPGASD